MLKRPSYYYLLPCYRHWHQFWQLMIALLGLTLTLPVLAQSSLDRALKAPNRSVEYRARDVYRHPKETLKFFDLRPDMTVVEIWPGSGGWYTEILAPYLAQRGKLYVAQFDPQSKIKYFSESAAKFERKMTTSPIYKTLEVTILDPPKYTRIAPLGSVDRVLVFRNVHNWLRRGDAEAFFKVFYRTLKPGGILGVVQHRNTIDATLDDMKKSGYVSEQKVIDLATAAGFHLQARAEINANPKDNRNHPEGVWTLPPSYRLGERNKEKYRRIGESDRMTLKFIKPPR